MHAVHVYYTVLDYTDVIGILSNHKIIFRLESLKIIKSLEVQTIKSSYDTSFSLVNNVYQCGFYH